MISNPKIRPRSGFTLIEVLLGVLLLSFVSVCVYGTFNIGMDLSKRLDRQKSIFRQSQLVMNRFAKDIESAVSYDFAGSYPEYFSFDGKTDAVVFVVRSRGRLKVLSYYLTLPERGVVKKTILGNHYKKNIAVTQYKQEAASAMVLVREEMDFVDFISGKFQMSGEKETMTKNIPEGGLKFSYAGRADSKAALVWKPDWKDSALPVAVRMNLIINDNADKNPQNIHFEKTALIPGSITLER